MCDINHYIRLRARETYYSLKPCKKEYTTVWAQVEYEAEYVRLSKLWEGI